MSSNQFTLRDGQLIELTQEEWQAHIASLPAAPTPAQLRAAWEEAAIRQAAKALKPNREAVDSLIGTRPSADHAALKIFRAEVIRISTLPQHANGQTLVSLAASTDQASAFVLLNTAYTAAATAFYAALPDLSPAYRLAIKKDFDLVLNQIKAAS